MLVQEKKPEVYGQWNLPAGKVDKGFTIEQTAIKEAKEETGYDIELLHKVGIYQNNAQVSVKHIFAARITGGELAFPRDEILDAKWFAYEDILAMKNDIREGLAFEAIQDHIKQKK